MKHEFEWPQAVQESANKIAESMNVCARIHPEDFIFRFIYDHPGFDSKESAIAYYFNDGRNSAEKVTALARKFLGERSEQKDLDTSTYGQTITSQTFVEAQIARLETCEYM